MKKVLIATGLALSLASSGVLAHSLYVNDTKLDGVNLSNFTFTNGNLYLTTSGATVGVLDGNDGGANDGGGNDGGGNDGGGNDGGGNDGGGCTSNSSLTCTSAFNWKGGESNTSVSIPKGKTLVTPFTTTANPAYYGEITFESHTSSAPPVRIWISKKAGSEKSEDSAGVGCSRSSSGAQYEIVWAQRKIVGRCALTPNTTYYFNIKHTNSNQAASITTRTRTNSGNP